MVVTGELTNWKQSQRLFSFEDDTARGELNNIQRWFESLAELLWRLRQLAKQVFCVYEGMSNEAYVTPSCLWFY